MATSHHDKANDQPNTETQKLANNGISGAIGDFYTNPNLFHGEYSPPNAHYETVLSTMVDQTLKGYDFTDENTATTLSAAKWLYLRALPQSHRRMSLVHGEPDSIFKFEDQVDLMFYVRDLVRNYFIASLLHSLGTMFLTQGDKQIPSQSHQQIVESVREQFGLPKVWELKNIKN